MLAGCLQWPLATRLSRVSVNKVLRSARSVFHCIYIKFYRPSASRFKGRRLVSSSTTPVQNLQNLGLQALCKEECREMFMLRSAFWLGLMFMMIVPGHDHPDLGASANALSTQAMAAGEKLIVDQINQTTCTTIKCAGSQAMIAALISASPSVGRPMHDSPAIAPVPLPRPRPSK